MIRTFVFAACMATALATATAGVSSAQMDNMQMGSKDGKATPSPRKTATVALGNTQIDISYGAPSLRGRTMVGDHDPYGKVWRLGANEATSFKTSSDLQVGGTTVPAGSYTLFALPTADKWTLIISKKTGEWGIPYPGEGDDFARVPMTRGTLAAPQETLSLSFEKTTSNHTELHVKWGTDNYSVLIVKK